jgi:hypothetical protein
VMHAARTANDFRMFLPPLLNSMSDRRVDIPSAVAGSRMTESFSWIMHEFDG